MTKRERKRNRKDRKRIKLARLPKDVIYDGTKLLTLVGMPQIKADTGYHSSRGIQDHEQESIPGRRDAGRPRILVTAPRNSNDDAAVTTVVEGLNTTPPINVQEQRCDGSCTTGDSKVLQRIKSRPLLKGHNQK
ncbi:hypothetical protein NDU88_005340 [Pleurodeles waltl]|uniref:Uncharacterized protein n=1 Tax=Pleurodeles waltl TaxID=8319 RepID=A0AAV7MW02_PLEWA|nr:hypothetical protein NDU88_005340 [Pleurodeles waltl]